MTQILCQFFGGNFHNYEIKEIMTNSQKSVKIGPDRADFFVITVWTMRRKKAQNIVVVWGYLHGEIGLLK